MANPEHLAILNQGVGAWNEWRHEFPDVVPDLRQAEIGQLMQRRADPRAARRAGFNLRGALLDGAGICDADLQNANCCRAHCRGARLIRANLTAADLDWADLSQANLSGAKLAGTSVAGTDFEGAWLHFTVFAGTDLSEARNLERAFHAGPSTIGLDTFFKSKGRIPEAFLRGCGVPDIFVEYAVSLVGKPLDFYSCFISYSTKDEQLAQRLHADLQAQGVRCWFAPEDLKIGDKFRVAIDETIRVYDKLLLVLSEHSVHSEWVEKEVETAMEREREQKRPMLFPIRLDDAVMEIKTGWPADIRRSRHIGDLTKWKDHDAYQKAFERLLRDLKASERTGT